MLNVVMCNIIFILQPMHRFLFFLDNMLDLVFAKIMFLQKVDSSLIFTASKQFLQHA